MSRRRSRKSRTVHNNGKANGHRDAGASARRARDQALEAVRGPEFGSHLGRLLLSGAIDRGQYTAGQAWCSLADRYHRAMNGPLPSERAVALERLGASHEPDSDSAAGRRIAQHEAAIVRKLSEAYSAMLQAGAGAASVTRRVCEQDKPPNSPLELAMLVKGLTALAAHLDFRPGLPRHRCP